MYKVGKGKVALISFMFFFSFFGLQKYSLSLLFTLDDSAKMNEIFYVSLINVMDSPVRFTCMFTFNTFLSNFSKFGEKTLI